MGMTTVLTVVKKMITDTERQESKTQKVIAEESGCSQSAVSKHITGKLESRGNCDEGYCACFLFLCDCPFWPQTYILLYYYSELSQ